jgi:hypothetical protein
LRQEGSLGSNRFGGADHETQGYSRQVSGTVDPIPRRLHSSRALAVALAQRPDGQNARQYLQQRLPVGSTVTLDEKTADCYGRLVAEVFKDININLVLVEDGQAFAYRQNLSGCDAKEYLDAEFRASQRRYGVWQVEGGITRPWDFRRGRRYSCKEIGSYARAQKLLRQGQTDLESNRDGEACKSLRR